MLENRDKINNRYFINYDVLLNYNGGKIMEQRTEEQLVKDNLGLVGIILARYDVGYDERDDFFQIGCIGLCKAAEGFDRSKNIKFSTYAAQCIQNEILMEFRNRKTKKWKKMCNMLYFSSPVNMHNDNEGLVVEDIIFDENQNIEAKKEKVDLVEHVLNYIVNKMDPRERYILLCRAGGIKQEVIANDLGISQSFTSRLAERAASSAEKVIESNRKTDGRYQMKLMDGEIQISFEGEKEQLRNALCKINLDYVQKFTVEYSGNRLTLKVPADADSLPFIGKFLEAVEE